jgi:hypothetical protein
VIREFKAATADNNELLYKVCGVVISPTGERQYVTSAAKIYDVLIAPRMRGK